MADQAAVSDDVAAFFALARDVDAKLAPDDRLSSLLQRIASDATATLRFRNALAGVNDLERLSAIRDLVARVAISLESEAIDGDNWSDLLDRYIAPVAGGTSVAGLVALMATSTTAAPVIVAVGLCGLALAGASRFWMKATATSDKRMSKLVARLLDSK
jgi:hypothetical protein